MGGSLRRIALTFDFDAMSVWIGSYHATSVSMVSRGEFGAVGVERILELLATYGIQSTFFIPGHTALAYPALSREVLAAGHEVGHHGFVHERIGELEGHAEEQVLARGFEILQEVLGMRPIGYRSPSWEFTARTLDLLLKYRFVYDSSLMASDYVPYYIRAGDSFTPDEAYVFGSESPVLELPVSWLLDDFPHFEYVRGVLPTMKPPSQVYEAWWSEYDYFQRKVLHGCFTLTMHPQVIGRGSRLEMLERLIVAMGEAGDAKFSTLGETASAWLEEGAARDNH